MAMLHIQGLSKLWQGVMTHQEFIAKVAEMRSLQKEYFRDRSRSTLDRCKFIEREVDRELEKLTATATQTTLF